MTLEEILQERKCARQATEKKSINSIENIFALVAAKPFIDLESVQKELIEGTHYNDKPVDPITRLGVIL